MPYDEYGVWFPGEVPGEWREGITYAEPGEPTPEYLKSTSDIEYQKNWFMEHPEYVYNPEAGPSSIIGGLDVSGTLKNIVSGYIQRGLRSLFNVGEDPYASGEMSVRAQIYEDLRAAADDPMSDLSNQDRMVIKNSMGPAALDNEVVSRVYNEIMEQQKSLENIARWQERSPGMSWLQNPYISGEAKQAYYNERSAEWQKEHPMPTPEEAAARAAELPQEELEGKRTRKWEQEGAESPEQYQRYMEETGGEKTLADWLAGEEPVREDEKDKKGIITKVGEIPPVPLYAPTSMAELWDWLKELKIPEFGKPGFGIRFREGRGPEWDAFMKWFRLNPGAVDIGGIPDIPDIPVPDIPVPDIPTPDVPVPDIPTPDLVAPEFPPIPVPDIDIPHDVISIGIPGMPDIPEPPMPPWESPGWPGVQPSMPAIDIPQPGVSPPSVNVPTPDIPAPPAQNIYAPALGMMNIPAPPSGPTMISGPGMAQPVQTHFGAARSALGGAAPVEEEEDRGLFEYKMSDFLRSPHKQGYRF